MAERNGPARLRVVGKGLVVALTLSACGTVGEPSGVQEPAETFLGAVEAWCKPETFTFRVPAGPELFEFSTPPELPYWPNQVVLTGENAAILELTAAIGADLDGVPGIDLTHLDSVDLPTHDELPISTVEIALFSTNAPVAETIKRAADLSLAVIVEPNYVISAHTHGIFGGPLGIFGGNPGFSSDKALYAYQTQWGLRADGIEYTGVPGARSGPPPIGYTGSGVTVVAFDTSPFAKQGIWEIKRHDLAFQMCVSLPPTPYMIERFANKDSLAPNGIYTKKEGLVEAGIEHGLFVSGLIKSIAPGSKLYLVRVLDDKGISDTFTLIKAMTPFVQTEFGGIIVNASLGFHLHEGNLDPSVVEAIQAMIQTTLGVAAYVDPTKPIVAVRIPFYLAQRNGSFTAAAAGNSSFDQVTQGEMDYPAHWGSELPLFPFSSDSSLAVLSVGASSVNRIYTCYSNAAEVVAPGGEGGPAPAAAPWANGTDCDAAVHNCGNLGGECELGVISLITSGNSDTGFAYWLGTSFSTPMASGLAALIIEKHANTAQGGSMTPAEVKQEIIEGACHYAGRAPVVNIRGALGMLTTCP